MENKISLGQEDLAPVLDISIATLKRWSSQEPHRLPPAVLIGEGGRGRRVWLATTVAQWLKEREAAGMVRAPAGGDAEIETRPPAATPPRRGTSTKAERRQRRLEAIAVAQQDQRGAV